MRYVEWALSVALRVVWGVGATGISQAKARPDPPPRVLLDLGPPKGHGRGRLATRRTPLLLRGSSVTERLRVAGNADWQEKRVPRCWPSVNCGTSGLESGAGNLLPSTAKSSTLDIPLSTPNPLWMTFASLNDPLTIP
jgi:hypothetical protein